MLNVERSRGEYPSGWLNTQWSHHQSSMNPTASQIGSIFSEIHGPQPLHHPVVGPLRNLCRRNIVLSAKNRESKKRAEVAFVNIGLKKPCKIISKHLVRWPSTQAVWLVVVKTENLDSSLDTQVMKDASHFQRKEVILKGKVKASVSC